MQPLRRYQLPAALGLKPRFWSSFTFMCKWVYFEAKKQEQRATWGPKRSRLPVVFVGPHPRLRQHAERMFGELPPAVLTGALSGVSTKVMP